MERVCRAAVWTVVAVLHVTLAYGQTTATLRGQVRDAQGAAVPSATVTVSSRSTGLSRTVPTNSDGSFVVANLPPSVVDLTVSAKGFSEAKRTGLVLEVGQAVAVEIELTVAGVREPVDVAVSVDGRRHDALGRRRRHSVDRHRGAAAQRPQLPRARAARARQRAGPELRSDQVEQRGHLLRRAARTRRQHHHRRRRQQRRRRRRNAAERDPGVGAGVPDRDEPVHGGDRGARLRP